MDFRVIKIVGFLALFVVEFILSLKIGFNGARIFAMAICLLVVIFAYFRIGEKKK